MRALMFAPALFALSLAAQTPAAVPASQLLAQAQAAARPQGRTVLVAFHASWCSWCRRLEATLARPAVKPILDRHFVLQWLTVQERGAQQALNNPGAAELYAQWTGGAKAGIPFCAVLDGKGGLIASSIRALTPGGPASNIGYPGSAEEIQAFLALLQDGAPSLSAEERAILARELDAAKPQ